MRPILTGALHRGQVDENGAPFGFSPTPLESAWFAGLLERQAIQEGKALGEHFGISPVHYAAQVVDQYEREHATRRAAGARCCSVRMT